MLAVAPLPPGGQPGETMGRAGMQVSHFGIASAGSARRSRTRRVPAPREPERVRFAEGNRSRARLAEGISKNGRKRGGADERYNELALVPDDPGRRTIDQSSNGP